MNEDDDDGVVLPHDNPHQSPAREKSVARKIRARSFWRRRRPFPEPSLRGWWTDDYDDDDDYHDNDDDYNDYDTGWSADDRGGGRGWFPDNTGWVSRREDKDKEDNVSDHDLSVANHDQV